VSDPLAIELATFRKHRDELVGSSLNKYVLIHGDQIVSTYESEQDAINEGYRQFGNVTFLVKRITPVDLPLNFLSGLVRL